MRQATVSLAGGSAAWIAATRLPPALIGGLALFALVLIGYVIVMAVTARTPAKRAAAARTLQTLLRWHEH